MKITVITKPNAKQERVEKVDDTHYRVWIKARPQDGEANEAVLVALSHYFSRPKSALHILTGHQSKQKTIALSD